MVIPKVGGLFKRFSGAAPSNQKPPGLNRVQLGGKTRPVFDVKNINGRLLSDVPVNQPFRDHSYQRQMRINGREASNKRSIRAHAGSKTAPLVLCVLVTVSRRL